MGELGTVEFEGKKGKVDQYYTLELTTSTKINELCASTNVLPSLKLCSGLKASAKFQL